MVGPRDEERLLCPVRATELYVRRTEGPPYKVSDIKLIRHPNPLMKTRKSHIARWIRLAITTAYEAAGEKPEFDIKAHEVRAVANSLIAYSGATTSEIMKAGRWQSQESFFRHYCRDMSAALGARRSPIVAVGRLL